MIHMIHVNAVWRDYNRLLQHAITDDADQMLGPTLACDIVYHGVPQHNVTCKYLLGHLL